MTKNEQNGTFGIVVGTCLFFFSLKSHEAVVIMCIRGGTKTNRNNFLVGVSFVKVYPVGLKF